MNAFCGLTWHEPTPDFSPLARREGAPSGLSARAIQLPGSPPPYARDAALGVHGHSIAWQIVDEASRTRVLIAPHVSAITPELDEAMNESDAVLFDGTFWSNDELRRVRPSARTAAEMGHLPVSESLRAFGSGETRGTRFICTSTTPTRSSRRVRLNGAASGGGGDHAIGEDGMEFEL